MKYCSFVAMWNEICPHSRQRIFHICGANISQQSYFTCLKGKFRWKKPSRFSTWLFSWQGREDSNPRPTVLEWLQSVAKPWKCSLFRTFQHTFQAKPRVVIVSEIFWCYFDDMRNFWVHFSPRRDVDTAQNLGSCVFT